VYKNSNIFFFPGGKEREKSKSPDSWCGREKENTGRRLQVENLAGLKSGRPERARTVDLYRVNYEVLELNPFACLAFPVLVGLKMPRNSLVLVTSW